MLRRRIATSVLCLAAGAAFTVSACAQNAAEQPSKASPAPAALQGRVALSIGGTGLLTADIERAVRFYREGLGMVEMRRFQTAEMDEVIMGFGAGSTSPPIFLLKPRDPAKAATIPAVHRDKMILGVKDAAALVARLKASGYSPGEIQDDAAHGVKVFWVSSPDGHRFEIVERRASAR